MNDAPLVSTEAIFAALVEWNALWMRAQVYVRPPLHLGNGDIVSVQRSPDHYCNIYSSSPELLRFTPEGHRYFDFTDHTPPEQLNFEVWYPGDNDPTPRVTIDELVSAIQGRGGLLPLKVQAVLNRLNNPGEPM